MTHDVGMKAKEPMRVCQNRHILLFIEPDARLLDELMRNEHVGGVEGLVELLLSHEAFFEHDVLNRAIGLKGFLGHLRRGLVADIGVQGGNDTDGVLHHL